jgi:predicted  nucleic acid-binding Zn-ribbon protein
MILNVVILTLIIPPLQHKIAFMEGQATSIQSQVNNVQAILVGLSKEITQADAAIGAFNAQMAGIQHKFNVTETQIDATLVYAQGVLLDITNTSAETAAQFDRSSAAFSQQLNTSLGVAERLVATIQGQVSSAQANVSSTLALLANQTAASRLQLAGQYLSYLASFNASAAAVAAVRDDFVLRVVPDTEARLSALNQTAAIAALRLQASLLQTNLTAVSGRLTPLQTAISAAQQTATAAQQKFCYLVGEHWNTWPACPAGGAYVGSLLNEGQQIHTVLAGQSQWATANYVWMCCT